MIEIREPWRVLVSPRTGATAEFGSWFPPPPPSAIARVAVDGGTMWVPGWDRSSTNFDAPRRVEVWIKGATAPRVIEGDRAHFVQVFGGSRSLTSRIFRRPQVRGDGGLLLLGADAPALTRHAPTAQDVLPYILTSPPGAGTDEDLAAAWASYLGAYDQTVAWVASHSVSHPVASRAAASMMRAWRSACADRWRAGDRPSRVAALQLLAGALGYFNAHFRDPDGSANWSRISAATDAGIADAAAEAAVRGGKVAADVAASVAATAKKIVETPFDIARALVYGAIAVVALGVGIIGWRYGGDAIRALKERSR